MFDRLAADPGAKHCALAAGQAGPIRGRLKPAVPLAVVPPETHNHSALTPPIEQPDLLPHGEHLQILIADQGMDLAVRRAIVVCPELLEVMQECGLFRGIETTERELYWAGILCEEFGGANGASLQLPANGHDAGFDGIEARLQPVPHRSIFSPE